MIYEKEIRFIDGQKIKWTIVSMSGYHGVRSWLVGELASLKITEHLSWTRNYPENLKGLARVIFNYKKRRTKNQMVKIFNTIKNKQIEIDEETRSSIFKLKGYWYSRSSISDFDASGEETKRRRL